MSELDAAGLMSDWGEVFSTAAPSSADMPGCHCGALGRPWQVRAAEPAARDAGLDPDAPDFDIRFAQCFVAACRQGLVPRRRKRGLLGQMQRRRGTSNWIRHAIRYFERAGEGADGGEAALSPPQRAVARAIAIHHDPQQRALLRRLLVSHGANPDQVARVLELDAAAVAAYRTLLFDFGDRAKEPFRFFAALKLADEEDLQGRQRGGDSGFPPLAQCAGLEFSMVLLHSGRVSAGRGHAAAGLPADVLECMDSLIARRKLLLHADEFPLKGRLLVNAVKQYKEVHAERRKQADGPTFEETVRTTYGWAFAKEQAKSDSKPLPGPARLTPEELTGACALWQQCTTTTPAMSVAATSLQQPWRKSKELEQGALPAERSRPDFGNLLANRVAAAGRSAQLPSNRAFHWICLMAARLEQAARVGEGGMGDSAEDGAQDGAEDPDAMALRRSMELHDRPASRQLLQAALLTSGVEIPEVAAFLMLDTRVVDAYACLFFNLPARLQDPSRRHAIEAWSRDGRDPLDGGWLPPGRGLADEMKAASGITLADLRFLLGFDTPEPQDAAARLLELVGRGLRRGENRAKHGSAQFETAVRQATDRISVHDPGGVSSGPNGAHILAKNARMLRAEFHIEMLMKTKNLTPEEAQQLFDQQKGKSPHYGKKDKAEGADEDPA